MKNDLSELTIDKAHELFLGSEASPSEVVEFYSDQISSKDKEISAFLHLNDGAKAMALESDKRYQEGKSLGELDGVVIAVKDNICYKDYPVTAGSQILKDYKAPYTATALKKLIDAGATIIGKTNLDEFAMGSSTENSSFGLTKNPRDISRVPGGSSGGSAAAVAGDMCVAALGSDTGGSIRQPASYCGVVGFKPSYGSISRYGLIAYGSSLDQIGPITKNVADTRKIFNVMKGKDKNDATSLDYTPVKQKSPKLKVGLIKLDPMPTDSSYQVFRDSVDKIKGLEDIEVDDVEIPNLAYSLPVYYIIAFAESSSNLSRFDGIKYGLRAEGKDLIDIYRKTRGQGFGPEVRRRIILGTFVLSAGYYDAYYKKAMQVRTLIKQDFQKAFEKYDVLIMPTAPDVAFKFGEKTDNPLTMYLSDIYTVPINLAGIPAVSIPCGLESSTKMPVGFQVLGSQGADDLVLNAAEKFEKVFNFKITNSKS